jgi:hypothetical protein
MNIESIEQEPIDNTDAVMTRVVVNGVASQCILVRLIIDALGRPGVDNDLEFFGSGDRWIVVWTHPQLTVDETRELVGSAIAV